jgi:hypothetical protein
MNVQQRFAVISEIRPCAITKNSGRTSKYRDRYMYIELSIDPDDLAVRFRLFMDHVVMGTPTIRLLHMTDDD